MRAIMSVGPAGANGTITLTACVGYSAADSSEAAFCAKLEPASTRAAGKISRQVIAFIGSSLDFRQCYHWVAPLGSHETGGTTGSAYLFRCVYRKLDSAILTMKSAEDRL